jgi:hypothetical protein
MWRIVAWALLLLAAAFGGSAAQAQDDKKQAGEDLKVTGKLSADDPKDKVITRSPHKVHEHKLKAGSTYIIDLKSNQFDSYLRLEDSAGTRLAEDDDGGGFPNARIVHKAAKDDTYRIIVTSYDGKGGAYTLSVSAATEAYAKLNKIKSDYQAGMMAAQKSAMVGNDFDMDKYFNGVGDLSAKFLDRYLEFVKENETDSSIGEAKQQIQQMIGGMASTAAPAAGEKLRSLIAKAEDKELLGPASLALGQHLAKRYEAAFQKKDTGAGKFAAEAKSVLEQTAKEYANLGSKANDALFDLEKLSIGRKAMEIDGEDIDGKKFKLSDYRGKVVVIDFWGDW